MTPKNEMIKKTCEKSWSILFIILNIKSHFTLPQCKSKRNAKENLEIIQHIITIFYLFGSTIVIKCHYPQSYVSKSQRGQYFSYFYQQ